jgi:hypothetical protein
MEFATRHKLIIQWPEYFIENFPEKLIFSTLKVKMSSEQGFVPET